MTCACTYSVKNHFFEGTACIKTKVVYCTTCNYEYSRNQVVMHTKRWIYSYSQQTGKLLSTEFKCVVCGQ